MAKVIDKHRLITKCMGHAEVLLPFPHPSNCVGQFPLDKFKSEFKSSSHSRGSGHTEQEDQEAGPMAATTRLPATRTVTMQAS